VYLKKSMKYAVIQQFLTSGLPMRQFVKQFKQAHPAVSISAQSMYRWIRELGVSPEKESQGEALEVVNVVEIPETNEVIKQMQADKPPASKSVQIVVQGVVHISFDSDFPAYDAARVAALLSGINGHEESI
jgi:ribonucleotide monophosphatase NagD (HAD superfamily)